MANLKIQLSDFSFIERIDKRQGRNLRFAINLLEATSGLGVKLSGCLFSRISEGEWGWLPPQTRGKMNKYFSMVLPTKTLHERVTRALVDSKYVAMLGNPDSFLNPENVSIAKETIDNA